MSSASPTVIAMETSGRTASIALWTGDQCDVRFLSESGRRHAKMLVPELRDLFKDHGLNPNDADVVAATTGPGSFTGLRVGVACAKTLAWSCGLDVIGVTTFDILARQLPDDVSSAWLAMNAERGELFVSRATFEDAGVWTTSPWTIVDEQHWVSARTPDEWVSGPLPERSREQLATVCHVIANDASVPRADTLARIALERYPIGNCGNAIDLVPTYGRRSAAEEKADMAD